MFSFKEDTKVRELLEDFEEEVYQDKGLMLGRLKRMDDRSKGQQTQMNGYEFQLKSVWKVIDRIQDQQLIDSTHNT